MNEIVNIFLLILFTTASYAQNDKQKLRTVSGYEYTHHISNKGDKPTEGSEVTYHREIYINNDSLLQSTYKNAPVTAVLPARAMLNQGAPPDYDAMFLMAVGDSMTLIQSLDSIPQLPPFLSKDDVLTYRVKLVAFRSVAEIEAEKEKFKAAEKIDADKTTALIKDYAAGKLNDQIKTTASGLKYIVHEEGTGKQAVAGKEVKVNYYGALTDGTAFDNSFKRGQTFNFPLGAGRVIKGWDEGIALLKEGSKATLFIPAEMGYGAQGSPPIIPGNAELVFYVELEKVD